MGIPEAYVPFDRRYVLATGGILADCTEGTVLTTDIAGFTRLTARLTQEFGPARGPEMLGRWLNFVYDDFVTCVQHYGGSVIGFSGDGLTCWFPTVTHAEGPASLRATACAFAIQTRAQPLLSMTLPSGQKIKVGVKVTLAAGSVRRFRVGDPHIQYIDSLAGQTLVRAAQAEKVARPGEVVVSPEVLTQLDDQVQVVAWRKGLIENQSFAVITAAPSQTLAANPYFFSSKSLCLTPDQIRPWLLPAVYQQFSKQQFQSPVETRPTTALFVGFEGIDYDDDVAAGEKLDLLIKLAQNMLLREGGDLLQLTIGDKGNYFYVAFGQSSPQSNHLDKAITTALRLRRLLTALDFITMVKMGISWGWMRLGAYGGRQRCTYGVLGEEVNRAAKLMSHAQAGQIMVSQPVAERVSPHYHTQCSGFAPIKDKADLTPVSTIQGRRLSLWPKPTPVHMRKQRQLHPELIETAIASDRARISRFSATLVK
jgi:class 3 adenylate cyclase